MEVDSFESTPFTIRVSRIEGNFVFTISDGGKEIEFKKRKYLLTLLRTRKGAHLPIKHGFLEVQPTRRGPIIRHVSFTPKYTRIAIRIPREKITPMVEFVQQTFTCY